MKKSQVAHNRKANFDIAVERTLEAGLVLTGDEIKSIRAERAQLTGGFIRFLGGRPYVIAMHLSLAKEPERSRPLLLKKGELSELRQDLQQKGRVAVPLDLYIKRGWAKLSIGVGTGRKRYDKRELLKKRDLERDARQAGASLHR